MKESAITLESLLEIMNNLLKTIDEKDKQIADLQQRLDYMLRQKFCIAKCFCEKKLILLTHR